uniref:RxLR effector candidate protein n=1 Tax=Hyaloperonospora arabidopsidis (strain Emoy2) TaxID=559515 RepID=M4B263_HYAAE|nr:RxLR effector candidate protein [Hyaloperonospora arabidopsidis Emoy2]
MRLHPFALLASAAILTSVTVVSGVSGTSKGEGNSAVSVPPFVRDSDDDPCIVPLIGQNTTKDEARTFPELPPVVSELLEVVQKEKPFEFKLLDTSGKKPIGPAVLNRMGDRQKAAEISADRAQAAWNVWEGMIVESTEQLEKAGLPPDRHHPLPKKTAGMKELRAFANAVAKRAIRKPYGNNLGTHNDIVHWVQKQPQRESLSDVLNKYQFIPRLTFEKVRVLAGYVKSDAQLIETLLGSWGSVTKFTAFLSIAKLSPTIKKDAVVLQKKLLDYWSKSEKRIFDVIELLEIKTRGLTYETLDTLVEFVALKDKRAKGESSDSFKSTLKHLDEYFGVENYFESNTAKGKGTNGQANAQPGTSHQDVMSQINNIASKEHNQPSILLGTESVVKRKAESLDSGRLRKKTSPLTNDVPEDDPGFSLVLR